MVCYQAIDIEQLRQENQHLHEEKSALQIELSQLAEESSYAKELASPAGVELKNLSEEITRLLYQNAKLVVELTNAKESALENERSHKTKLKMLISQLTVKLYVHFYPPFNNHDHFLIWP